MTERDDETWQAIVDNYGERAALDDAPAEPRGEILDPAADAAPDRHQPDPAGDSPRDSPGEASEGPPAEEPDTTIARALAAEERFVPPPAPPLPYIAPPRLAAGIGVFGAPLVLVVCVIAGISIPGWLGYLLVGSFVGGFAYLVWHMKKRPDDPWDDGARI